MGRIRIFYYGEGDLQALPAETRVAWSILHPEDLKNGKRTQQYHIITVRSIRFPQNLEISGQRDSLLGGIAKQSPKYTHQVQLLPAGLNRPITRLTKIIRLGSKSTRDSSGSLAVAYRKCSESIPTATTIDRSGLRTGQSRLDFWGRAD